ncbi:MAG: KpsF/GutQ family sugar-phosphate isomerase [Bacteroidota bacterium]
MDSNATFVADEILEVARATLRAEAEAIQVAAERLGDKLPRAVELILSSRGKVVIIGMGKSGHIGQKIAATLCSTGTPAVFLHAAEATHGDLGIYTPGDPTILISKSGATAELVNLIPTLRQFKTPLIGILGNLSSPLARQVDVVLDARVAREADPLNLAPTSSSTVALALGDALAAALMQARKFSDLDFARYHPSGQLGRNLLLRVADVMHVGDEVAWVAPSDTLRAVVIAMTKHPLGAACVVDGERRLHGIITDGDLRRALQAHDDIRPLTAADIMTAHPIAVAPDVVLRDAAQVMEDRPSQISVLPVIDEHQHCAGLLRIHDVYQTGLA